MSAEDRARKLEELSVRYETILAERALRETGLQELILRREYFDRALQEQSDSMEKLENALSESQQESESGGDVKEQAIDDLKKQLEKTKEQINELCEASSEAACDMEYHEHQILRLTQEGEEIARTMQAISQQ